MNKKNNVTFEEKKVIALWVLRLKRIVSYIFPSKLGLLFFWLDLLRNNFVLPTLLTFFFCKTDIVDLNTVAEKITSMLKYLLFNSEINLQPLQPDLFYIRYPVSFAGYPVKLLNKLCKLRMSKLFSEPFHQVWNKSKIVSRNVGRFCWKLKLSTFCFWKKIYIYYLAGYPVSGQAGYPESGEIIGRISGQISIRHNPTCNQPLLHLETVLEELVDGIHRDTVAGAVQLHGVDASLLPPFKETVNKFWV